MKCACCGHDPCADPRDYERAVVVGPASMSDGRCSACGCDEYGRVPERPTLVVCLRTKHGNGGLQFRLCEKHFAELVERGRQTLASPTPKFRKGWKG